MQLRKLAIALVMATLAAPALSDTVTSKTRAQVREELIEAQRNGLRYITDASYPDISPIYRQLVAQRDTAALAKEAVGAAAQEHSSAGHAAHDVRRDMRCEGPASFCNPYFGS
jgi:hypothetical protein